MSEIELPSKRLIKKYFAMGIVSAGLATYAFSDVSKKAENIQASCYSNNSAYVADFHIATGSAIALGGDWYLELRSRGYSC